MSKNYLTPEGHQKLKSELSFLLKEDRPKTVQAVSEAAAMGDRSENAEYIYGKRRLREIDRRIRFLQKRLENVELVDPKKLSLSKVAFGLWVEVEDQEDGRREFFQIVGPDEISPKENKITLTSPIGKALLGKGLDDEVTVRTPSGPRDFLILSIDHSRK